MKIKKEYLILITVIVVLGVYLALQGGSDPDSDLPRITALDTAKINRMVITQADTAMELTKKDERWFILPSNYPVNPAMIKNMIKSAAELTVTALVSESGNYQRYGLDDAKQIKVQVYDNNEMTREFGIGRNAPTQEHAFVVLAKDTKVYHAKGKLKTTFERTVESLRDKTALTFDKEAIASLQIQKGDKRLALTKTEIVEEVKKVEGQEEPPAPATKTQWQSEDGTAAANPAVTALLGSLSGLKCEAYMADDAKAGFTEASWTVTLKDSGPEHTLSIYAAPEKEATQIPGTSSYNDFAFLLSKSRVEAIEKQINKLLAPEPKK